LSSAPKAPPCPGRRFAQTPVLALRGASEFNSGPRDLQPASDDTFDLDPIDTSASAGKTALSLLVEVYGQVFGLGIDDVPFQDDGEIDLELLNRAAHKR
jgi:hypothetical protein